MKQTRQKQNKKQQQNISGKQKAFIAALIAGAVLIIANVFILVRSLTGPALQLDQEFTMRTGDIAVVEPDGKKELRLTKINDHRCPKDAQCIWAGQIEYEFSYNNISFVIGSGREQDRTHKISSDISLDYVDGDMSSGTFILRKVQE